jgi:hypothetical protein
VTVCAVGAHAAWGCLVLVVVVAALVGALMAVLGGRRRHWHDALAASEDEVDWFATVLLHELERAGTPAAVRRGWGVGRSRVVAVEDRLTALAASAPATENRRRATTLRDGVQAARARIDALPVSNAASVSGELAEVAADLHLALGSASAP